MKTKGKPEEVVRQNLVLEMTKNLGFPKQLILLEKSLSSLPHLKGIDVPDRRVDVLVYGNKIHPDYTLYPLLLVEVKAERITKDSLAQVVGYNAYIGAYYIALACSDRVLMGWRDKEHKGYRFQEGLASFDQMMFAIKRK